MQLVFHDSVHHIQSLVSRGQRDCPASSLKIFGQPLIVRNIRVASSFLDIDKVMIPESFSHISKLVQDNFPSIDVEEFSDYCYLNKNLNTKTSDDYCQWLQSMTTSRLIKKDVSYINEGRLEIPLNTFIDYHYTRRGKVGQDTASPPPHLLIDTFIYPWDFLRIIQKVLCDNIRETVISPNASIAKSSIIEGPCIIEDNVTIDDFCKIKGPTYIGNGSFIGMGSLIRNCMLGEKTNIGFNCEIAKSYFAGCDKMAHQNVILDSIIGEDVWFGGYSGTANVLLNKQNIRYEVDGKLLDTGTNHFGAVVGNNCAVGAAVIILPGRQVPSYSLIQAGTIFGKSKKSE